LSSSFETACGTRSERSISSSPIASTLELDADVAVRDWALEDPHGQPIEQVREIRDAIEKRVADLFDEFTDSSIS
jgi:protein-tyrosine-phosphatase